jgi:hypothetical protein
MAYYSGDNCVFAIVTMISKLHGIFYDQFLEFNVYHGIRFADFDSIVLMVNIAFV